MAEAGRWGNIEVFEGIRIAAVRQELRDALNIATREAVTLLTNKNANPFPCLPQEVFAIFIVQSWEDVTAYVIEKGLKDHLPKKISHNTASVSYADAACRIFEVPVTSEMIVGILEKLREDLPNAWSRWLVWRMRRKYTSEWLELMKENQQKAKLEPS